MVTVAPWGWSLAEQVKHQAYAALWSTGGSRHSVLRRVPRGSQSRREGRDEESRQIGGGRAVHQVCAVAPCRRLQMMVTSNEVVVPADGWWCSAATLPTRLKAVLLTAGEG